MEWSIPIQKLEVSKVSAGHLQKSIKPITPLAYSDGPFVMQHLNILLPPLPVKDYDAATGKLVLNLTEHPQTAAKLFSLQETLLSTVYNNQRMWFNESNRPKEQIQALFQPFLESNLLHLYCPLQTTEKKHFLYMWNDGAWSRLTSANSLQKGHMIRVGLRMQGISYQMNPHTNTWTGRFRVQHRIICIYHCGSGSGSPALTTSSVK